MGMYWLLDRHGGKGPSILVEADGAMRVIDVVRFGPKVTKLEDVVGALRAQLRRGPATPTETRALRVELLQKYGYRLGAGPR